MPLAVSLVVVLLFLGRAEAQPVDVTPEANAKAVRLAEAARAQSPGAPDAAAVEFYRAWDAEFGAASNPISLFIHVERELSIAMTTPMMRLREQIGRAVGRLEPLPSPPQPGVVVRIQPRATTAKNIDRVVALKGSSPVDPLETKLVPTDFKTRNGGAVTLNAGTVTFPTSMFDGSADVTVICYDAIGVASKWTMAASGTKALQ